MNFLHNILRSFYDFSFYKEVRTNWTGWALGYTAAVFALILGIGVILGSYIVHRELVAEREGGRPSVMDESLHHMAAQWPDMIVQNDTLISDAPMPHIITIETMVFDKPVKEEVITIDTRVGADALTYDTVTTPFLVTSKEMIAKKGSDRSIDEVKIYPLKDFFKEIEQPTTLNAEKMNGYVTDALVVIHDHLWKFYLLMGGMTWLFLIPVFLVIRILLLVPLAVAGLILAKIMGRALDYNSAIRVIGIALIPLTIIEVFALVAFTSGVSVWIKVLVSLGVLAAILSNEPKKA